MRPNRILDRQRVARRRPAVATPITWRSTLIEAAVALAGAAIWLALFVIAGQ